MVFHKILSVDCRCLVLGLAVEAEEMTSLFVKLTRLEHLKSCFLLLDETDEVNIRIALEPEVPKERIALSFS